MLDTIGKVAYRLKLPPQSRVHPIFHVSLLKRCIALGVVSQTLPNGLTDDWELKVQPSEVLAVRKNSQGNWVVLINWLDMPEFESSWELAEDIKLSFPDFHLEDKVVVWEGGIVGDRFPERVYMRKKYRGIVGNVEGKGVGESGGPHLA